MMAVHCGSGVEVQGGDTVTVYPSSDWAERAFCSRCGTHLYYRLLPANEYVLSVGLFQDREFAFTEQIFVDRKPDSYRFADHTEMKTEADIFAQYGG